MNWLFCTRQKVFTRKVCSESFILKGDQYSFSPYVIGRLSSRRVLRIKKVIKFMVNSCGGGMPKWCAGAQRFDSCCESSEFFPGCHVPSADKYPSGH